MEDLDLKEFLRNLFLWGIVVVVFGSLMTVLLVNKFGSKDIRINQVIDKKENVVVLIINNQTKNTKEIQEKLKKHNIKYETVNRDKERYYDEFLRKISMTEKEIIEPAIIIIEDKEVKETLVDIKDMEELDTFLDYNK